MRSYILRVIPALVGVSLLGTGGCDNLVRNRLWCGDGLCVDPERPFCDVEGVYPEAMGYKDICIPQPPDAPDARPVDAAEPVDAQPRIDARGGGEPRPDAITMEDPCYGCTIPLIGYCPDECHAYCGPPLSHSCPDSSEPICGEDGWCRPRDD